MVKMKGWSGSCINMCEEGQTIKNNKGLE